jgi:hypothetical protein
MKYLCNLIMVLTLASMSFSTQALQSSSPADNAKSAESTQSVFVISDFFYQHPTRLSNVYYGFWHLKGPALESAIKKQNATVNDCDAIDQATLIISVEPYLFYNPQVKTYYTQLIATYYSAKDADQNKPIYTKNFDTTQFGGLTYLSDQNAEKVYAKAFKQLLESSQNVPIASTMSLDDNNKNKARALCQTLKRSQPTKFFY